MTAPLDLAALRAVAEKATPSKRCASEHGPGNKDWLVAGMGNLLTHITEAEARFVAACDRETVLALLDRIEAAEKERDLAIAHDRQPYPTAYAYEKACEALRETKARLSTAEQECERLRGERDEIRSLKVPPSVDDLLLAQMEARTAQVERDAAIRERDEERQRADANWASYMRIRDLREQDIATLTARLATVEQERDEAKQAALDTEGWLHATKEALSAAQIERDDWKQRARGAELQLARTTLTDTGKE